MTNAAGMKGWRGEQGHASQGLSKYLQESGHQAMHLGLHPVTQAGTLHHQGFIREADPVENLVQGGGRGEARGDWTTVKREVVCVG